MLFNASSKVYKIRNTNQVFKLRFGLFNAHVAMFFLFRDISVINMG